MTPVPLPFYSQCFTTMAATFSRNSTNKQSLKHIRPNSTSPASELINTRNGVLKESRDTDDCGGGVDVLRLCRGQSAILRQLTESYPADACTQQIQRAGVRHGSRTVRLDRIKKMYILCGTGRTCFPFLPRDAMHSARTMPSQDVCPSVCLSVCLSHAGILSKRLFVSSNFFHHRVATPF